MGCGCGQPVKKAKYICKLCGKVEEREVREGEIVKSCCGQIMEKKKE